MLFKNNFWVITICNADGNMALESLNVGPNPQAPGCTSLLLNEFWDRLKAPCDPAKGYKIHRWIEYL